ncbi:MAG: NuoB/complex I 20 kDa subunit family protein [Propionibacteriaceae bacterium]
MGIEESLPPGILLTSMEAIVGWTRHWSLWPLTMGLACCAIEMMDYGCDRSDADRWGQAIFRASPRQADVMIVSGRVCQKMAPVVRRVYDQMPNPKWVISMGACASSGGMFNNYAVIQGCDHIVPVDVYLPGCPPRPEMLIDAMFKLKLGMDWKKSVMDGEKIKFPTNSIKGWPLGAHAQEVWDEEEKQALVAPATHEMKGLMR